MITGSGNALCLRVCVVLTVCENQKVCDIVIVKVLVLQIKIFCNMKQTSRCFFYVSEEFKPESMNVLVGKKTPLQFCLFPFLHSLHFFRLAFKWMVVSVYKCLIMSHVIFCAAQEATRARKKKRKGVRKVGGRKKCEKKQWTQKKGIKKIKKNMKEMTAGNESTLLLGLFKESTWITRYKLSLIVITKSLL